MIKVVVSAIIKNQENKILCELLNKEKPGGVWVPPGGKLEADESTRECLVREVKEEIDITIKVKDIVAVAENMYKNNDSWLFLYYECDWISGKINNNEPEKILDIGYKYFEDLHFFENIKFL